MGIIRIPKQRSFVSVSNALAQDASLSFETVGMLVYLLSKPDDWQLRTFEIEKRGDIGKTARRSMMIEAEKAGYLTFHTARNNQGQLESWYDLHEQPVPESDRTESWETGKKKPGAGFPPPVDPTPGNPSPGPTDAGQPVPLQKTEVPITEKQITEVQTNNMPPVAAAVPLSPAEQVFDHWRVVCVHPGAKLDPKRKACITKCLKLGFTVEELKRAVDGCKASEWHQGNNDRSKVYDDIDLIFRDAKHVEQFLRHAEAANQPPATGLIKSGPQNNASKYNGGGTIIDASTLSPKTRGNASALHNWLAQRRSNDAGK